MVDQVSQLTCMDVDPVIIHRGVPLPILVMVSFIGAAGQIFHPPISGVYPRALLATGPITQEQVTMAIRHPPLMPVGTTELKDVVVAIA